MIHVLGAGETYEEAWIIAKEYALAEYEDFSINGDFIYADDDKLWIWENPDISFKL